MKIDIFSHILTKKYGTKLKQKTGASVEDLCRRNPAVDNLDLRFNLMDRAPEVMQVLTMSEPALEMTVTKANAVDLAKLGNDELAELVLKYPQKFLAAAACLPMNNIDEALKEADRAIKDLGLKGVQIYSTINGESLDHPKYDQLYKKMAQYDLPIWIHPCTPRQAEPSLILWPYETSCAMIKLAGSGVFDRYPNIKFITHHCGGVIAMFDQRLKWMAHVPFGGLSNILNPVGHLRKFYADTATYGSTAALECGYSFFGADHLLFGTDAPLGPRFGITLETIKGLQKMEISPLEKEKIFSENAINILKEAT
jgi:uncharacterized protein